MKKLIYAALLVSSTIALSSFTMKNDSSFTKTQDHKNLGTADDHKNLGTADDHKNLGTADDHKNLGTADARTARHANDHKNLGTAD